MVSELTPIGSLSSSFMRHSRKIQDLLPDGKDEQGENFFVVSWFRRWSPHANVVWHLSSEAGKLRKVMYLLYACTYGCLLMLCFLSELASQFHFPLSQKDTSASWAHQYQWHSWRCRSERSTAASPGKISSRHEFDHPEAEGQLHCMCSIVGPVHFQSDKFQTPQNLNKTTKYVFSLFSCKNKWP